MPAVPERNPQIATRDFQRALEVKGESPKTIDLALALFRTENSIGSLVSKTLSGGLSDIEDPDFNPWDFLTDDEKLDKPFLQNVMASNSEQDIEIFRQRTRKERRDRETISNGGAMSFLLGFGIGGIIEPINYIPIAGATLRSYRTGTSILKSAIATGSVAAGSTAIQETVLHATQLERTFGESAINSSVGFFLGGILGGGATALKIKRASNFETIKKEVEASLDPEAKLAKGENSAFSKEFIDDFEVLTVETKVQIKTKLIEDLKNKLLGVTGNKLKRIQKIELKKELNEAKAKLRSIKDIKEPLVKVGKAPARKVKKEAIEKGRVLAEQERSLVADRIERIEAQFEADKVSSEAEANLSRLEQGILSDVEKANLEKRIAQSEQELEAKPIVEGAEKLTTKDAAGKKDIDEDGIRQPKKPAPSKEQNLKLLDSEPEGDFVVPEDFGGDLSAARVKDDIEVKGKVARGILKAFGFSPLTRLLLSKNPFSRKLINQLAENPILVEGGLPSTAVETLIKLHDGKYATALELHLNQHAALQKRLGVSRVNPFSKKGMSRKEFNIAVSKELRNPGDSNVPEIKKSAQIWIKELYTPLKDGLIGVKLLPEDVDVKTAVNYLNRQWEPGKIAEDLKGFVSRASRWLQQQDDILRKGVEFDKQDYDDIAMQIARRIMGSPDGRLPYDWKLGEGSQLYKMEGTAVKGPLKERVFNAPDELMEEFLENDIERLGARYLKQVAPDLEIAKAYDGDLGLEQPIADIIGWWQNKILRDPKNALALKKAMDRDIRDFAGIRDRIRGVYDQSDPNALFTRVLRSTRDLNYMRFMGGVLASSFPDMARIVMSEGFVNTFKNGLVPLITNIKSFKVAAKEGRQWAIGTDALTGGRSQILADITEYTRGGTVVERVLRSGAEKFGKVNMLDFWNAGVKQLHLVVMQTSIIKDLKKGIFDPRLERLGISKDDAFLILKQIDKHGKEISNVWTSGAKNWSDTRLQEIWGGALRKESDRVIVVPGQEKPLFMSTEMGKSLFQFRSFMLSSTTRILVAGIQGQEANYLGGTLMMTTFGMMTYAFKQWDARRPISNDPTVWITEGIDRSGSLGVIMEINNTIEKISNNNFGLRPLIGASAPSSRFASRNRSEALLGPTFGSFLSTTLVVAGAGSDANEWKDSDTRALRRLIPGQNLMLLRQILDEIEGK